MKNFLSILATIVLLNLPTNLSAKNLENGYQFIEFFSEDCDDYAAMDYEITGSKESAEQAWNQCMDDKTDKLKKDMDSIP